MNVLHARETEIAIIGTAMESRECAARLADLPEDFFSAHDTQAAHRAVRALVARDEKIDLITLEAEASKEAPDIAPMLVAAAQEGWKREWFGQYVSILDDRRKRRALLNVAADVSRKAQDPGENPDSLAENLSKAGQVQSAATSSVSMVEAMAMLFDTFGDKRKACQTGIAGFDRLTGGVRGGKLIVIGARPGVGKTALALSMAKHVARHTGGVLVVSLEMSAEEIMARLYASESGVDVQELESGRLSDATMDSFADYAPLVTALPIRIATRCTTPIQIRREAQRMREKDGLALVVVDYLQLLKPDGKHGSRYEEVSEISRELKLLAMDLGVPVLALSQFSRASEAGKNGQAARRAPMMAEAKDSGSIEQDANIFVVQWAPTSPGDDPYAQQAVRICDARGWEWQQLIIEKNRQGRTGKINVGFDKAHMVFQNLDLMGVAR